MQNCRFYAQAIAMCLRISTMAENEMAAPYSNTKYSRKLDPVTGSRVNFDVGRITGDRVPVAKGLNSKLLL
jgi:hypothetical protein